MPNFKKSPRAIIIAAIMFAAVFIFAFNRSYNEPLIEMQMVYEENPAHFFTDMKLIWDDTDYYVVPMRNPQRGREIGYADDEHSIWRIYELNGYGRDYLFAQESEDVWRVMSVYPEETPWRQYILENATERQRGERMLSVSLYSDGTVRLSTPPISSYMLAGVYMYNFTNNELLVIDANGGEIARFDVISDDIIVFRSASVPLFADNGARYVVS